MRERHFAPEDMIAVCISRQIVDGEMLAQGIATPLVTAGYLLAKLTHAPHIVLASAIGQAVVFKWAPIGITTIEQLWIRMGQMQLNFAEAACDLLPHYKPKEFFRPGQVDASGNFNNVFIGGDYDSPRLRLPGVGGIPDMTAFSSQTFLYVPRHGRHTFVERVDFRSGLGHDPERRVAGAGPRYLVSNLGQFDFEPESGRMRVLSTHPGVTVEDVIAKTGFELIVPDIVPESEPPNSDEIHLLNEVIDPLGVRTLETLSGARRKAKLREILSKERAVLLSAV